MMQKNSFGIEDDAFIRGKVPMTKEEVRCVALAKLQLSDGMTLVDVGAGTGSISIEAAGLFPKGQVYAIEMKEEGIKLIEDNKVKFDRSNIHTIMEKASVGLQKVASATTSVDRLFIGGVGDELEIVLDWAQEHVKQDGRIVMNMILMESFDKACRSLRERGYEVEACRLQVERLKKLGKGHYMAPLNGVYILWASKK